MSETNLEEFSPFLEVILISVSVTSTLISLGLCPEQAYEEMIKNSLIHLEDDVFWNNQLEQDLYIQEKINDKSTDIIH